jgi:REP element-mobilizing transposase RayT
MAQSLSKVLIHILFSTKERYPFLTPDVRPELHAYAATVLKNRESPTLIINSVANHVHALCLLSRKWAVAGLVEELKTSTSKWIKTEGGMLRKFYWQNGYGAFSVSQSMAASVRQYIANQEEHHRHLTFQDELRSLLRKHEVEYDERYLWD